MGFMGLLKVALKYVIVLAWPFFALGYPLWASIQVIETKSLASMQKLIAYWISFSTFLLFEHAFEKLIEWLSFWCYIRLVIIFFLVMHDFAGSLYVYERLVRPCLSGNLQTLIMKVNEVKKLFYKKDTFLTELEKYVKEHGTESLENLVATKSGSHPCLDKKEINRVTEVEQRKFAEPKVASKDVSTVEATNKKEGSSIKPSGSLPCLDKRKEINRVTEVEQPKFAVPKVASKDISTVEGTNKKEGSSIKPSGSLPCLDKKEINRVTEVEQPKFAVPKVASKDISTVEGTNKKEGSSIKPISPIEPKLPSAKTNAFAPPNPIGISSEAKECVGLPNKPFPSSIQKEWTCALCGVTTTSEADLASHLKGRRHRAAHNELKAKNHTPKMKAQPASDGKKCIVPLPKAEKFKPGNDSGTKSKTRGVNKSLKQESLNNNNAIKVSQWPCFICNVKCNSQMNYESHLNGSKHLAKFKVQMA